MPVGVRHWTAAIRNEPVTDLDDSAAPVGLSCSEMTETALADTPLSIRDVIATSNSCTSSANVAGCVPWRPRSAESDRLSCSLAVTTWAEIMSTPDHCCAVLKLHRSPETMGVVE